MRTLTLLILFFTMTWTAQAAVEFRCEVLDVRGNVTATDADGKVRGLKLGDLVSAGETVEALKASSVELSFDKEWKNIVRVEAGSKLKVASIAPAKLKLSEGDVFAKLKELPKNSSFEVQTPTAVASVRGTEYRITFMNAQTRVFNVSASDVFVAGLNKDGSVDNEKEVVLKQSEKTQVAQAGTPQPPKKLEKKEKAETESTRSVIQSHVEKAQKTGRTASIQSVSEMTEFIASEKKKVENKSSLQADLNNGEESRVVDLRRRPFRKVE